MSGWTNDVGTLSWEACKTCMWRKHEVGKGCDQVVPIEYSVDTALCQYYGEDTEEAR